MPLTASGKRVLRKLQKFYGKEKGERIFYAMINAGVKGSEKWHIKRKKTKKRKR